MQPGPQENTTPTIIDDIVNEVFVQETYDKHQIPNRVRRKARQILVLQHIQNLQAAGDMAKRLHVRMFTGEDPDIVEKSFEANSEIYKALLDDGKDCYLVFSEVGGSYLH